MKELLVSLLESVMPQHHPTLYITIIFLIATKKKNKIFCGLAVMTVRRGWLADNFQLDNQKN